MSREEELPYRFDVVPIESLIVDPAYQRPVGKLANEIAENFDPRYVGAVVVNERKKGRGKADPTKRNPEPDGEQYALIDGQHRVAGMVKKGLTHVPATVFEGMTPKQEAQMFADLQTKRRNITTLQRFKAQLAAGDKRSLEIRKTAEETGWSFGANSKAEGLRAIAALEALHKRGPTVLYRTLFVARRAWPNQPSAEAAHGAILRGLGRFIDEEDPDDPQLIRKLAGTTPAELRFKADAMRQGRGSGSTDKHMVDVITSVYTRRSTGVPSTDMRIEGGM